MCNILIIINIMSAIGVNSNTLFFNMQYEAMTSAAVDVIGAVCKRLTWSKYLYYLKHFIHVLQTGIVEQKLAVR